MDEYWPCAAVLCSCFAVHILQSGVKRKKDKDYKNYAVHGAWTCFIFTKHTVFADKQPARAAQICTVKKRFTGAPYSKRTYEMQGMRRRNKPRSYVM